MYKDSIVNENTHDFCKNPIKQNNVHIWNIAKDVLDLRKYGKISVLPKISSLIVYNCLDKVETGKGFDYLKSNITCYKKISDWVSEYQLNTCFLLTKELIYLNNCFIKKSDNTEEKRNLHKAYIVVCKKNMQGAWNKDNRELLENCYKYYEELRGIDNEKNSKI